MINSYTEKHLAELKAELQKETSKKFKKQNLEHIGQLCAEIAEIESAEHEGMFTRISQNVYAEINKKDKKRVSVRKWRYALIVCGALGVLLTANAVTISAANMNIFSFLIEFTKKGAVVNFVANEKEEIILPTGEGDDKYGIGAKCREVGIENIEIPQYLPDGFKLTGLYFNKSQARNYISFTYEKEYEQVISMTFKLYFKEIPDSIGFPSDEKNITEIKIAGHPAVMSREDEQMIVICGYDNYLINIATKNVDYLECDKILENFKRSD